jgi:type I restriction enzyme S subunit
MFQSALLEWRFDRLKDIVVLRNVKTTEKSDVSDYIELEDVESGSGQLLNKRNTLNVESAVTIFRKGDVLFGKLRPYLEKYFEANFDGKCTGEILAFKPERIESGFLRYCVGSPWFIQLCSILAYGTKMPRVNWPTQLATFDIPLPPTHEQKRIAAYLDASCRTIDAAVAAKRNQIEVLAGVFRATLQRAVTQGLGKNALPRATGNIWLPYVPQGWDLVMLKRACEVQGGLTLGKDYDGPLVERPYLRVANVQDGYLQLEDLSTIELPLAVADRASLQSGDVLMTEGGDLDKLGRGVVWQGEIAGCLHQNHVFAVRCFEWKLRPQFLAYVSASQYGRDYFEATGKKTTNLAATNSTKVGQFPIPLPSVADQDDIIEFMNVEADRTNRIRQTLEQQIKTLTAYRKSLIHECVTGQRRITDEDINRVTAHATQHAHNA